MTLSCPPAVLRSPDLTLHACACRTARCVSYSGQCFSSEAWGGRSANRGQCAQACRMPYGLIVDGDIKVGESSCCSLVGGRSAKCGRCAQACRMPYGLIVDGDTEVGDNG